MIIINSLLSDVSALSEHSILSAAQKMLFSQIPDRHLCVRKSFENLLKTAKVKWAQIITPSSNNNRKFSINKNVYLNTLKAAEIDEYQLNSLTSAMRTLISFSAFVSKGDKPDCLLC